jgi:hypothetical protein
VLLGVPYRVRAESDPPFPNRRRIDGILGEWWAPAVTSGE